MPKIRLYQKKEPFRSASLFIIICEGEKREPEYFEFFNGISSRIKIKAIPSADGLTSPNHLLDKASDEEEKNVFGDGDEIWFVIDTDRWGAHIHALRTTCSQKNNWFVAQSNPCFEVWLYFHFERAVPKDQQITQGAFWKQRVGAIVNGGFNSGIHPREIETAILNSEAAYSETGYNPNVGSTQVFILAKKILPLIIKDLNIIKEA